MVFQVYIITLINNSKIITIMYIDDVDEQLREMANIDACSEREKYVVLVMDEMNIQSDLVYDKHNGKCCVSLLLWLL